MQKLSVAVLLTLLLAANASALDTTELLSTIAMPLAVAAVSNVAGVPQSQLASFVTTLNQANVPATRVVEVIRYVPVALVDQNGQPFVAYVQQQASTGVTGDALVDAIVRRLQNNYNVTPQLGLTAPATTFVVEDTYIPQTVITRVSALPSGNPLALIALPLAVAAVADIAGVPLNQLADFVATLNNANVPPAQMIELVRYVPVALVDEGQPFVSYVQQQTAQGVTGSALVPVVVRRLQPYYPSTQINVTAPATATPQPVVVERDFVPAVVVNRVAEVRQHPHGGPPGQIKKQLGLQTGAEVVHGVKPGRESVPQPMISSTPAPVVRERERKPEKEHGNGERKGHGRNKQVVGAPGPAPVYAPQIIPAPQPAAPAAPVVVPGNPRGNGRGPGGPPGQAKGHGNKGKGKD